MIKKSLITIYLIFFLSKSYKPFYSSKYKTYSTSSFQMPKQTIDASSIDFPVKFDNSKTANNIVNLENSGNIYNVNNSGNTHNDVNAGNKTTGTASGNMYFSNNTKTLNQNINIEYNADYITEKKQLAHFTGDYSNVGQSDKDAKTTYESIKKVDTGCNCKCCCCCSCKEDCKSEHPLSKSN